MKRYFGLVILPKKSKNSVTKSLIPGNAKETIEKLLNMIKIFDIGIGIPPLFEIKKKGIISQLVPAKKKAQHQSIYEIVFVK